jgi:hypothetical protein
MYFNFGVWSKRLILYTTLLGMHAHLSKIAFFKIGLGELQDARVVVSRELDLIVWLDSMLS